MIRCEVCGSDEGRMTRTSGVLLCAICRAENLAPRMCPIHSRYLATASASNGTDRFDVEVCPICDAEEEARADLASFEATAARREHLEEKS